jgi:hypothetical protein
MVEKTLMANYRKKALAQFLNKTFFFNGTFMRIREEGLNGKQIEIQLPPVFLFLLRDVFILSNGECNGLL